MILGSYYLSLQAVAEYISVREEFRRDSTAWRLRNKGLGVILGPILLISSFSLRIYSARAEFLPEMGRQQSSFSVIFYYLIIFWHNKRLPF